MTINTVHDVHAILIEARHKVEAMGSSAPEVIVTRRGRLRCPICQRVPEEWLEIDADDRINTGYPSGPGDAEPIVSISQSDQDYSTLAFVCTECDSLVRFPSETVEVVWS